MIKKADNENWRTTNGRVKFAFTFDPNLPFSTEAGLYLDKNNEG